MVEQRNTLEHQWNTSKYQQNTNVASADHSGTMEPYNTKNNCSNFKENVNVTLINLTLSTHINTDIDYLFIYFSLFKVGLHVVKKFFNK